LWVIQNGFQSSREVVFQFRHLYHGRKKKGRRGRSRNIFVKPLTQKNLLLYNKDAESQFAPKTRKVADDGSIPYQTYGGTDLESY
jgi:hypothetical protein